MPLNRSTLLRIKTIDHCLQNHYRRWTLQDLIDACSDALYEMEGRDEGVSKRTIQSDIQLMRSDKLGYNAPIVVKDKKYYTYDDPDYSITNFPLSYEDVEILNGAMDVLRHFQAFSQFDAAEDIINKLEEHISVSVKQRTPAIDLERNDRLKGLHFVSRLYQGIQRKEALRITYHSFKVDKDICLDFSPYLLKEYRNRWFLIGANHNYANDIQILAIDRMISIELNRQFSFLPNSLIDVEHFFDDVIGVSKSLSQPSEPVLLWFDADQAPYVLTKPLHASQRLIQQLPDGSIEIEIRVVLNFELEREILGFGEHIRVIAPESLREKIFQKHRQAAGLYHGRSQLLSGTDENKSL